MIVIIVTVVMNEEGEDSVGDRKKVRLVVYVQLRHLSFSLSL